MACLEVKGLPTTATDDEVVKTKLQKYFQIKRLSGGGECEPPELLPGGRARLRFKQQEVLGRVLKQQKHVLEINQQTYVLEVSRSGEEVKEPPLQTRGTIPTQVTEQAMGRADEPNVKSPVKPVTAVLSCASMGENVQDPVNNPSIRVNRRASLDMSTMSMYFESEKRSGGGDVTNVEEREQYWIITFEDPAVAQRVLSRSEHTFNGKPLVCSEFVEKPLAERVVLKPDPRRVLLRGFTRPVQKDIITLYVESCGITDEFSINYTDDDSCRVVSFSSDIDIQGFIGRCGKKALSGMSITAEQLPLTCSVILEDLPEGISRDYMELYLESRSGPAVKVTDVKFEAGDITAIIYLLSNEDVEKVLKSQLCLRGKLVTAHRYYESHGFTLLSWDEESFKVPEPQYLTVDPVLMEFIKARPEHSRQLQEFLKEHLATMQWPSGVNKDVMKIVPAFAENKEASFMLRKKWSKSISKEFQCFFDKYIHHSEVIRENIFDQLLATLSTDQQENVQIIPDKQQCQISIVGQKVDVESAVENLSVKRNNIFSEQERIKKLRRGEVSVKQAHVHLMPNFKKRLQRDFPEVDFHIDVKKRLIAVEGPKDDSLAAESKILQMMLQCSEKPWVNTEELKAFVLQLNRDTFINNTFSKNGIEASISERGNDIIIVSASEDDLSKAEDILNMTLAEVKVKGVNGFDMKKNVKEWDDFQEELTASQDFSEIGTDASFQMKCRSGNEILITGYRDVIQNVAKQVEEFMDLNASLEFFIALKSTGALKYLKTHGDIESIMPNATKIQPDDKMNGFIVTTKAKDKVGVMELIGDLSRNVICQDRIIKKPGCARFLHERGKIFLNVLETTNKCIILIDQHRDQQHTESQENLQTYVAFQGSLHGITVSVLQGQIQCHSVDVMVNAANRELQHIGGLARDLLLSGGRDIQQESTTQVMRNGGPFQEGEVVMTGPGTLPCQAVIHAIGPKWDKGHSQLKKALLNDVIERSIKLAAKHSFTSIAIPAISSGYFGFPLPLSCKIITTAVRHFCEHHAQYPTSIKSIHLINNDSATVTEMQQALQNTLEQEDQTAARSSYAQHRTNVSRTTTSFESDRRHHSERQERRHLKSEAQSPLHQGKEAITELPTFIKTTQPSNTNQYNTQEGLQIHLVKGNLEKEEVDVIVNTVAENLDLSRGAVSAALLRKAGTKLQELTDAGARGGSLGVGCILAVKTQGCNLACREVYHTLCCAWKEGVEAEQVLRQIVSTCLQTAQASKHQGISFPAIGTGNLGFPKHITAKIMLDEFVEFSKKNPITILQNIRIVVYGKDEETFTAFHNELQTRRTAAEHESREATEKEDVRQGRSREDVKGHGKEEDFELIAPGESDSTPSSTKEPQGNIGFYSDLREEGLGSLQMKFGKVVVIVKKGDIVKEETDAIVNSTDQQFSQGAGVSAAIMKQAGPRVQRAFEKQDFSNGVCVTESGNLPCKYIVHVAISNVKEDLSQVLLNALVHCDALNIASISLPALGTGVGHLSPRDAASAILDAVAEFSVQSKPKKLRSVKVIIFKVEMLQDFHNELQSRLKKHGPREKGFFSLVTRSYKAFKSYFNPYGSESEAQQEDNQTAQANMGIKPVHIQVFSTSAKINNRVLNEIDEKLTADGCEKKIRDEIIAEFGDEEQHNLQLLEAQNQVLMKLVAKDTISVEGNVSDVSQFLIDVHAMMNEVRKTRDRALQEELLVKSVQWMFLVDEQYIAFTPKYNALIEDSSKMNKDTVDIKEEKYEGFVNIEEKMFRTKDGKALPIKRKKTEDIIPIEWMDVNELGQERFLAKKLESTSDTYQTIAKGFMNSLRNISQQPGFKIEEITHIQNPSLWKLYVTKKKDMEEANKPSTQLNERILFHGTALDTCDKINTNGFNRSYCGKNATCYGNGVYFAVHAQYSAQETYSPADANGSKYMYRARVLTGEYAVGKQGMIEPPAKNQNSVLFDSVTDNIQSPNMFVIFNDNQAYPEYIIQFTL